jgi:flagella basal body P-ring formation protein FlgA
MRHLLLLAILSGTSLPGCVPVTASRILARDLALADSRYSALPSTLVAGFTAEPGRTRTLTAAQLQRLARANGLDIENPADLCFELPVSRLKEDDAIAAMRRVLPPEAILKLLEIQTLAAPAGDLEFFLAGLEPSGLWRGDVKYAETKKTPVWARVAITINYSAVVAATDLPADLAIPAGALRVEQKTGPMLHELTAASIADVAGRAPKRPVRAGALIPVALLTDPPDVHRGDSVRVEVRSGPALLHFDAIADAPARRGAIVELRNPASGKTFKARLDSPSTATVELTGEPLL